MKIEKRWIISFLIISTVAITGLFWPHQNAVIGEYFDSQENLNFADIAWLLTASCLVLLMTPGLSFFMEEWLVKKMLFLPCSKVLFALA